jgi:hypothetical protein
MQLARGVGRGVDEGCDECSISRFQGLCWMKVRSIAQSVDGTTYWRCERADINAVAALRRHVKRKGVRREASRR